MFVTVYSKGIAPIPPPIGSIPKQSFIPPPKNYFFLFFPLFLNHLHPIFNG